MSKQKHSPIAVVMGSDSDFKVMHSCIETLKEFDVNPVVRIISAHRTPEIADEFASGAEKNGIKVIIAAAGLAAHLAGALASRTTLPVIGVPMSASSSPAGLDALLSTVQMPPGVPVATVAIGKPGAKNAAYLALQILGVCDENISQKLKDNREQQKQKIIEKDSKIND